MAPKKTASVNKKIWRVFIKLILALAFLIILFFVALDIFSVFILSLGFYFNVSSSMPIGLYKVTTPGILKAGDLVLVCLPSALGDEGLKRNYLNPGQCSGGYSPIIKELIATPGDHVTLTLQAILVNGQSYFAPLHTEDLKSRPLTSIPRGDYPNTQTYWLYGAGNHVDSWDSRYWGGVSLSEIIKQAYPVLTF